MIAIVIIYTVIVVVLVSALVGIVFAMQSELRDLELKADRYEELYHELMTNIEKNPY